MTFEPDPQKNDVPARTPWRALLRRRWIWVLAAGLIGIGVYLAHATRASNGTARPPGQKAAPSPAGLPVVAVAAKEGDIGIYVTGLGSVTPLNTVTVKTRVDGELMKVLFEEGQMVKKGDLLAEIDPRPFQVQLTQAEGQMARDEAQLNNARVDLERFELLAGEDSIAIQQVDNQKYLVRQLEGALKIDQGQIDNAKLQLTYSRITAPVSGRIGLRQVDPGNIVHAGDTTGLAVITQLEPIAVIFPIPEDSLPPVLEKLKTGERLPVEAYDRDQRRKLATGHLLTADNQIDPATGTVRLKAVFPNQDSRLFPNQFVNARLLLDVKRGTIIVAAAALQRSSQGTFVYLVKADQTVALRPVGVGPTEGDNISIVQGLVPGDLVVVEGAERLREGSKVAPQPQGTGNSHGGG
ncbi:MAG TPA: MdtA/MuxA family multidrug efflux RND transporter periplasmic adaptor subunit [Syntrophobacteria bacterium]|nr:MdtA/MuxA family multidrug efflux RND transporter periplasmic adaptor subunit [Syntrophobacteria bacterium]